MEKKILKAIEEAYRKGLKDAEGLNDIRPYLLTSQVVAHELANKFCQPLVVERSSSNDKLVEIAVPENSLILTVNTTKHHNRKLFKEWVKEFFDDDVNFV